MSTEVKDGGALVSAGPAAVPIDSASLHPRGRAETDASCSNCGTRLSGAYCHACGQSGRLHRSLLHLAGEVLHGVLHFDAKGWRTLRRSTKPTPRSLRPRPHWRRPDAPAAGLPRRSVSLPMRKRDSAPPA